VLSPPDVDVPSDQLAAALSLPDAAYPSQYLRKPGDLEVADADPVPGRELELATSLVIGATSAPGGAALPVPLILASSSGLRQLEPSGWQPVTLTGAVGLDLLASGPSGFAGAILAIVALLGVNLWRSLERQTLRLPASLTGTIPVPPG
jgi:hypothetical protein